MPRCLNRSIQSLGKPTPAFESYLLSVSGLLSCREVSERDYS